MIIMIGYLEVLGGHLITAAAVDDQQGEIVETGHVVGGRVHVDLLGGRLKSGGHLARLESAHADAAEAVLIVSAAAARTLRTSATAAAGHVKRRVVEHRLGRVLRVFGYLAHDHGERLVASLRVAVDAHDPFGQVGLLRRDLYVRARLVFDVLDRRAALADQKARRRVRYQYLDLVHSVLQFVVSRAFFFVRLLLLFISALLHHSKPTSQYKI